jgi:Sigma-70, region 4
MDGTAKGQVGTASARLPERQRETLELHDVQGLSYEQIALKLNTTWACVAQLIAHARINLYDELHGTILASVAPSPECERAMGLIAARQDGQLGDGSAEEGWLDGHLETCNRCRRGVQEMDDARAAYRAQGAAGTADPRATRLVGAPGAGRRVVVVGLTVLLLLAGVAAAIGRGGSPATPVEQAAGTVRGASATPGQRSNAAEKRPKEAGRRKGGRAAKAEPRQSAPSVTSAGAPSPVPTSTPVASEPAPEPPTPRGAGGSQRTGQAGVEPPQRTAPRQSAPGSEPKPAPAPAPAPPPAPAPTPEPIPAQPSASVETPPAEEPVEEAPRRREPPGKPAHAGPK